MSRTICPYKGLAEFEAADADYYFGRERLIAELIARFVGGTFLGLVGDSGSGKSSALRAGLLPALAGGVLPGSDSWPQALLRPGEHPLAELGRALARALPQITVPADDAGAALEAALATLAPGQRLVLVVDQFEEVFNTTRDEAERSAFIELLTRDRTTLKVVVSLRADHYGRCAAYPALARLLGSSQVLVGPLTSAELAAVIEHPAHRVGLRVEPALTEALVADAGTEPGVLPLLETCLLELWGARDTGRLTLAAYRASGGLQGAIARLAEATYTELDVHRQAVARALLLRLAGPGEGAELVRRRVSMEELDVEGDPVLGEVLGTLTAARLLTTGEGHVEVAHEALLREWPRLQGWLADDAAGRQVRLHLIGATRDWQQRGRESGDLYRGARLAAALEWSGEHQVELNAAERAFLDESRRASEHEVERQRRTNRTLRALLAGAAVLLVAALGAGGFAALQGQRAADEARNATEQRQVADQQRALAEQAARNAQSRSLIASALTALDRDPSLAKLLAIEAITVADKPTFQSTSALHQVLAADPIIGRYQYPQDRYVGELWTDLDPTGQLLVASGGGGYPTSHLEVADARSGRVLWSYPTGAAGGTSGYIGPSWFSADGTQVIAGLYWGPPMTRDGEEPPSSIAAALGAMVWDAHTGEFVRRIDLGPCGGQVTGVSATRLLVWTPVPDPDGGGCTWLIPGVFGAGSLTVEVVDLVTEEPTVLSRQATWVAGGTLSGDGRFAGFDLPEPGACGKDCFTSVVIDLDNGNKEVFRLERDPNYHPTSTQQGLDTGGGPAATRLNYEGSLLLYGDDPTLVYDIAAGSARPIAREPGPGGGSLWAEFDRSGTVYEASPDDGTLRRWDPRTGQLIASWPAVGRSRPSVAIDGRIVLVSDGASPRAVLLDSGVRGELGEVRTIPVGNVPRGSLRSTALSPDRSLRATGGSDGVLRVWDTQSGELTQQMGFAGSLVAEVTFKDDRHLAVTLQTGEVLTMIIDPQELVDAVRASLTRSFTPGECATYGIDPCPTLEQIRAP